VSEDDEFELVHAGVHEKGPGLFVRITLQILQIDLTLFSTHSAVPDQGISVIGLGPTDDGPPGVGALKAATSIIAACGRMRSEEPGREHRNLAPPIKPHSGL